MGKFSIWINTKCLGEMWDRIPGYQGTFFIKLYVEWLFIFSSSITTLLSYWVHSKVFIRINTEYLVHEFVCVLILVPLLFFPLFLFLSPSLSLYLPLCLPFLCYPSLSCRSVYPFNVLAIKKTSQRPFSFPFKCAPNKSLQIIFLIHIKSFWVTFHWD